LRIIGDKAQIVLACVILFFVATNIVWLLQDQAPPMWDQAHYLERSVVLYDTITRKGLISLMPAFSGILDNRAPLITFLPFPFYLLFGVSYTSALCINIIFLIAGSYYFFRLGTLLSGEREALAGLFILNTFPLIFGLSREFLVEYGLAVFVVAWMYYLLASEGLADKRYICKLGLIFGLGMLMKITFALYIVFPTVFFLIKEVREKRTIAPSVFRNVVLSVSLGLLISGVWYFRNGLSTIKYMMSSGFGDVAQYYGSADIFSLKTIVSYWLFVINYGISSYYFFFMVFLLVSAMLVFAKNKAADGLKRGSFLSFLMIWAVVPFIGFTFGVNKDYRFIAPIYPALALLAGIVFTQLTRKRLGKVLFMLLAVPFCNYLYLSFSSSEPFELKSGQFILVSNRLFWAHPPIRKKWPHKEMMESIYTDASRENRKSIRVALLFDHPFVNGLTLNYLSRHAYPEMTFATNNLYSSGDVDKTATTIRDEWNYVITKSDLLGNEALLRNTPTMSLLNRGAERFRQMKVIQLPDNTFLTIYRNLRSAM
jgi:4-amino-4-deoxy-L-arabinose transferase-like glycosyltransferase